MAKRTRNYGTILYPESAPDNWLEILAEHKVPSLISPLHDKDTNPGGEVKKPHYHIIILFDSVKTQAQAQEIFDSIKSVGIEAVKSIRGYSRYLIHADNPDKYQYEESDVMELYGADYKEICILKSDKYQMIMDIIDYIEEEEISSYFEIMKYTRTHKPDWFRCLCDGSTFVIREYIKSKYWFEKQKINKEIDSAVHLLENKIRKKELESIISKKNRLVEDKPKPRKDD